MTGDGTAAKLRTMAMILKLGHDLFDAKDFDDAALRVVNHSRVLLNFRSAAFFLCSGCRVELAAQSGIPEKNPRSRLALEQKELLEKNLPRPDEIQTVKPGDGEGIYLIFRFAPPQATAGTGEYILLLEYPGNVPEGMEQLIRLLGKSIAEALAFHRLSGRKRPANDLRKKKIFLGMALLAAVAAIMFIRVPESATAEFTLIPEKKSPAYAQFDGTIARTFRQDGDTVQSGEVIAEYDRSLLEYRLEQAKLELLELDAKITLERHNSFTDQEKLGKVKLLELQKEIALVKVKEAQWFLDHAAIKAPAAGVLVYNSGTDKTLSGRAVRIGDELFTVYGGSGITAEIPVDEKDASILRDGFSVTAFLHTAPETAITITGLRVSAYPELTGEQKYCYKVYGSLPETAAGNHELRYGMRGVAKIDGSKVSLFYRLFKSLLLWFRGM